MPDADESVQADAQGGIDHEDEVGAKDGSQGGRDEAADGEGDECVRQEVAGLGRGEARVLGRVVDEEARDGHLSADVAELGDEGEDHVVLLVQRARAGLGGERVGGGAVSGAGSAQRGLADLGKLSEDEENGDGDACARDG